MTDKKLTDNEIVKALEKHARFNSNSYVRAITENALDLIDRLQAENLELKRQISKSHTDLAVYQIKLNTANAENDRLTIVKNEYQELYDELKKRK